MSRKCRAPTSSPVRDHKGVPQLRDIDSNKFLPYYLPRLVLWGSARFARATFRSAVMGEPPHRQRWTYGAVFSVGLKIAFQMGDLSWLHY
jgi:hypothetical protein